jgi:hypothetical protein
MGLSMMKKFSNPLIVFPVTFLAMYSFLFNLLTDNWCYCKKTNLKNKINESIYLIPLLNEEESLNELYIIGSLGDAIS